MADEKLPYPVSPPGGESGDDMPGDGSTLSISGQGYERPLEEGEERPYVPDPPLPRDASQN